MTPNRIQFELKERRIQQKKIAQQLGVSEMTVSRVIHQQLISDRVMRAVAEAIGRDHRAVFPEYYFSEAQRSTSKKKEVNA